jgi:hypothetical protein
MIRKIAALSAAGMMLAYTASASAAVAIYDLNVVDNAAGLGSGPFGTVTVTENAGGTLSFLETLAAGFRIHDGNANHNAFVFSVLSDPNVTVSNLTAGFTAFNTTAGSNVDAPPFGSYFTGIDCSTACGPGFGGGYTGMLSFTLSAANPLTVASLGFDVYNGKNIYFATDLVNSAGNTGNVGAVLRTTPSVPEPAIWAMMLIGFGAIGYSLRRRNGLEAPFRFA